MVLEASEKRNRHDMRMHKPPEMDKEIPQLVFQSLNLQSKTQLISLSSIWSFKDGLVGGLEHLLFSHIFGIIIIPIDELIFFRGVGIPPTSFIDDP